MKKNFKEINNPIETKKPAEIFIEAAGTEETDQAKRIAELEAKLKAVEKEIETKKEPKTKRLNFLIRPSQAAELNKAAKKLGISRNQFIEDSIEAKIKETFKK